RQNLRQRRLQHRWQLRAKTNRHLTWIRAARKSLLAQRPVPERVVDFNLCKDRQCRGRPPSFTCRMSKRFGLPFVYLILAGATATLVGAAGPPKGEVDSQRNL